MQRIKNLFFSVCEWISDIPNPNMGLKDKLSLSFFIDLYIFIFIGLITLPWNTAFNLCVILVFIANFIAAVRPFLRFKVWPSFGAFFRGKTRMGKFATGYFLLLFLTFLIAYIHSRFLKGMDMNTAKFFTGYYIFVFAVMPLIVLLVFIKVKISLAIKRLRR